jgi:uncharacterized protein with GYD domain
MPKYVFLFTYSGETWNRMIDTPSDRAAAVRQVLEPLGGSLEVTYFMFGAYDGLVICDVPDSISAAALSVAVNSSGAFKHLETHEALTQDQLNDILGRAKSAKEAYRPPGL